MDVLAVTLIVTFVLMLVTAAIALLVRRPPAHRTSVTCPDDHDLARVAIQWDPQQRRMLVAECDHPQWRNGQCQKSCQASLQNAFPEMIPTTVVP
jgi:hypothetical protein